MVNQADLCVFLQLDGQMGNLSLIFACGLPGLLGKGFEFLFARQQKTLAQIFCCKLKGLLIYHVYGSGHSQFQ